MDRCRLENVILKILVYKALNHSFLPFVEKMLLNQDQLLLSKPKKCLNLLTGVFKNRMDWVGEWIISNTMKKIKICFLSLVFILTSNFVIAQMAEQKLGVNDEDAPVWVKMINSEKPNVFEIQKAFNQYREIYPKEKNTYTQYYKRWLQKVARNVDENGYIKNLSSIDAETEKIKKMRQATNTNARKANVANWTHAGPEIIYNALYNSTDKQLPITGQANVRSITFSASNPSIGYAASETGGVYKTIDKGQNWTFVTRDLLVVTSTPIQINPLDANECIFFSHSGEIMYKTTNGGVSWEKIDLKAFVYEIRYNEINPQIIYAATNKGVFKTVDGGKNWLLLLSGFCSSLLLKPDNQEIIYVLKKNEVSKVMDFYKSIDGGKNFLKKENGWFIPIADDLGKVESDGGKLAVTPADPNRIYALLVGLDNPSSRDKFNGFIGIYVSKDSGESWQLPNGPTGRPYSQQHPNLMSYGPGGGGHQIYYNTTLAISKINPEYLLIGGVTLWKSLDGAKTFVQISQNAAWLHPDMQDIKTIKTSNNTEDVWIANDGGIQYSKDFMISFESRTKGIAGGTYWGFDQGQLEDVMIGGRYHNGNSAYLETYPSNNHLRIGGGEGATGYVNPADNRIVYASDIGTVKIPSLQNGILQILGHPEFPHENYVRFLSSRMAFDPHYYNTVYIGKDNNLKKSTDGANTYNIIKQFGTNKENKIYWIEVSSKNSNLIFLDQKLLDQPDVSIFWNTKDGGNSWEQIKLPLTKRDFLFTLSSRDEKELWVAFPSGDNGKKVYKSIDGGKTWQNLTTPKLNDSDIEFIVHQAGTLGGIYLGFRGTVLYKNDSMSDWVSFSEGLPIAAGCLRLVPFYKKEKLRYASRTHSIWESDFYEPSKPVAIMSASKKYISCNALDNSVEFLDLSDHRRTNISRIWSFQGGNPVSSILERPTVRYDKPGKYKVSLTVSDDRGSSTEAIDDFIIVEPFVEITPYNFTCQADTVQLEATTANQGYTYQWKKDDKVITNSNSRYYSALEDGEYSVIAQKDGCSFESSKIKITVLKRLSGAILGVKDICTGASINLTAKGIGGKPPYSYQWFRNSISLNKTDSLLSISEAGFYSLIVSDSRGCLANIGDTRILLKGDKLSASIKPNGNITINQYETVILKANTDVGFTYQWLKDNKEIPQATTSSYEVKQTGSYSVKVFLDGCFVISEPVLVTLIPITSNISTTPLPVFEVFPNPMINNCVIRIRLPKQEEVKLDLVDTQGRVLRTWELGVMGSVDREINLEKMNEGEYIFILHLQQNQLSKKIIISRKE